MGFLSNLFGSKKQEENVTQKISKAMSLFTQVSIGLVPEKTINENDNFIKINMYLFGALDYLHQSNDIDKVEAIGILSVLLMNTFNLSEEETGSLIRKLMDNTMTGHYTEYMDIGGKTIFKWLNGDTHAPMKLYSLLMSIR